MTEGITLNARQINHGQSEIWLGTDGREVTERRTLATNEVVNAARRHCSPEVFDAFYKAYHAAVGRVATLTGPNVEVVAAELRLQP